MMTLYVLGSGSAGNCFAVETDGVALLIDAGFSGREIERRAALVGLELSRVAGLALTHEHGDHARGASGLARRLQVPIRTGPRVGVAGAGGDAAAYPWRFWLDGEPTVSVYRPAKPRRRRETA